MVKIKPQGSMTAFHICILFGLSDPGIETTEPAVYIFTRQSIEQGNEPDSLPRYFASRDQRTAGGIRPGDAENEVGTRIVSPCPLLLEISHYRQNNTSLDQQ